MTDSYPTPFQQGRLDSLCGIYSIVNTIHALYGPLTRPGATGLFIDILEHLEDQSITTLERLAESTNMADLSKSLQLTSTTYPIRWARPFHQKKGVTLDDYWLYLHSFFADKRGIVIINAVRGEVYDHWTTAYRVSLLMLLVMVEAHLFREAWWRETGEWLGPEKSHDEIEAIGS